MRAPASAHAQVSAAALSFRSEARTHAGRVRAINEDRFLDRSDKQLWAVADGMGGHQSGELASGLIVEALDALSDVGSGYTRLAGIRQALQRVNLTLINQAGGTGGPIGSTVVTLVIHGSHFACVWAGDSRAYRCRNGDLIRLTTDHSLVQALQDAGALRPEDARTHPKAHVITRAVGHVDPLALDVVTGDVEAGDIFLLCSDGLSGLIDDQEIADILVATAPGAAADRLLELALDRGGRDNVTLVLVRAFSL